MNRFANEGPNTWGRPVLGVRTDVSDHLLIENLARQQNLSKSAWVRYAIAEAARKRGVQLKMANEEKATKPESSLANGTQTAVLSVAGME